MEDTSSRAWAEPAGARAGPTAISRQEQGAALPFPSSRDHIPLLPGTATPDL